MDIHHSSGWGVMTEVEMSQRTYVLMVQLSMVSSSMYWIGIRMECWKLEPTIVLFIVLGAVV